MLTANFRQQHVTLGQVLTDLGRLAKANAPGSEVRAKLVDLSGKLSMHLAGEDKLLYPALAAAKDPKVAAMAKRYADEMGGLAGAFKAFSAKYNTPAVIEADRAGFATALGGVTEAVVRRVQAEERELYAAADALP